MTIDSGAVPRPRSLTVPSVRNKTGGSGGRDRPNGVRIDGSLYRFLWPVGSRVSCLDRCVDSGKDVVVEIDVIEHILRNVVVFVVVVGGGGDGGVVHGGVACIVCMVAVLASCVNS